jgi:hypothetical protein
VNGYDDIRLTGGGDFQSLQFLASSGFIGVSSSYLEYQLLEKGKVVATGTLLLNDYCCRAGSGWEYVGFRGGGFDEVRLQDTSVYATFDPNMPPTTVQALALDNIAAVPHGGPNAAVLAAVNAAVPEVPLPAALPLFATGLAGLGLLGWRRKKKAIAA